MTPSLAEGVIGNDFDEKDESRDIGFWLRFSMNGEPN
jgi:hypothetical protein